MHCVFGCRNTLWPTLYSAWPISSSFSCIGISNQHPFSLHPTHSLYSIANFHCLDPAHKHCPPKRQCFPSGSLYRGSCPGPTCSRWCLQQFFYSTQIIPRTISCSIWYTTWIHASDASTVNGDRESNHGHSTHFLSSLRSQSFHLSQFF